jgi:uncharacterized protein YdaU (DUF1376 family)
VNHYKRHIGDWIRDTAHLSALEEGIYSRLIDQYYSREKPLPADVSVCCKLARANSKDERAAVAFVLGEYFVLGPEGYGQKRCDEEVSAYAAKAEKNRQVGKLGGRPPNFSRNVPRGPEPSGLFPETQTVSIENQDGSKCETNVVSGNNPSHKPVTSNQKKDKKGAAAPWVLPSWIDATTWGHFEEMRLKIKKPMTDRARELVVMELEKFRDAGHDVKAILEKSTRNNWQDVYAPKDGVNGAKTGGMVPAGPKDYRAGVGANGKF